MSTRKESAGDGRGRPFSMTVPDYVRETCYELEGIVWPNLMPPRCLHGLRSFGVRPDDLYIVTFPKSGTTWAEHLVLLIKFEGDMTKYDDTPIRLRVPFLEAIIDYNNPSTSPTFIEMANQMESPRLLRTHVPPSWLPEAIRPDDPKSKVIYVARNPKDTAVSGFHFCRYLPQLPTYETWDIFFEEFINGRVPEGSWFENVLPWWKARHHRNVLFLKYEDMKQDPHRTVKQLAEFMGKSLSDDVMQKIVSLSSFDAMRKSSVTNPDFIIKEGLQEGGKSFMRKGVVGDWKNYFSADQNKRFDELYRQKMAGSDLDFDVGPVVNEAANL